MIQDDIDLNVKKLGLLRVVVHNGSGPADVPENVSVDFHDCSMDKLTTRGNNRINVERGTIASADLTGTAAIIRNATISGDLALRDSKVELHTAVVQGKVTLE
jgi:hypothetical protein